MENGPNKTPTNTGDETFDKQLHRSLKVHGFIFPDTEDEVEEFRQTHMAFLMPLPAELEDPMTVFNREQPAIRRKLGLVPGQEVIDNLAQAAREGKDISEDIRKRMESDRRQAEDDQLP